ncbi:MAG: tetratricopeptide repeat protein [Acidimicrobiia bacterium]|nr:tetratricopeptide repeat protein [Acidimicrobiia bacterium]
MGAETTDRHAPFVPVIVRTWGVDERHRRVDGSLVFIDVSGFTALSERLAQKGRIGAEEVAGVLNSTFTELLTIASSLGGDLLKFGGDALLLLFTGPDHPTRAANAAHSMRSRLRTVGHVDTPAGKVRLGMSVGVHSGDVDLFVVGDLHRELIVTGPAASTVVEMESTAESGEVLLSAGTAAALEDRVLGDTKGKGRLLARSPHIDAVAMDARSATGSAERFVPIGLRNVVATPAGDGEHRIITVGFIHFTGADSILNSGGPEALWGQLNGLVTTTQRAAADFGVAFLATDIDGDGGKLILTAGAPMTTGSDEEQMLRATRTILDTHEGLPIQIGVNRGPAFAGDVGAPFRRTYTVIGDAVNLSARVMARADHGELLATQPVLDNSAALFDLRELEPFMVKGKSQPVHAWAVGGMSGRRSAPSTDELPFIGRDSDLDRASNALHNHDVGLIDVVGAPGIGKSRFVRALRRLNETVAWHFAASERFEASNPYFPFQRLLREVLGIDVREDRNAAGRALAVRATAADESLIPWIPLLATVLDVPSDPTPEVDRLEPRFRKSRTHEMVVRLLDATLTSPTALIIEDAHWLDDASRDLTEHLATAARSKLWTFITVRQPTDATIDAANRVEIALGPLPDEASIALATRALEDHPLLDRELERLVERSGGNPLFLIELVSTATTEGADLPDSVEGLVMTRIDRLEPAQRQMLRYASVVGASFDLTLLCAAVSDLLPEAGSPEAWKALHEFVVPRSSGHYRFRQEVFHDVAYSGLPYRTRRMLHERIGSAIESRVSNAEDVAARLAFHFSRAQVHDKTWRYARLAGDRLRVQLVPHEAADNYKVALASARPAGIPDQEIRVVAECFGDMSELAGLYDQANEGFGDARRLLEEIDDTTGSARLMRKQGMLREKGGNYSQALRWFSRGLRRLDEFDGEDELAEEAEISNAYAGVLARQAKYAKAIGWCERALDSAGGPREASQRAHALKLLGLAHRQQGHITEGADYTEQSLEAYRELGDLVGQADALNNLGGDAYYQQDWKRAADLWEQSTEARQKVGDVVGAAMAAHNIAVIRSDQGRWDEADELFHRVRRVLRAAGYSLGVAVVTSNMGRVASRDGRHAEAEDLLSRAEERLTDMGADFFSLEAKLRIAELHVFCGATDLAQAALDDSAELVERVGTDHIRTWRERLAGYVLLQRGGFDEAAARFESGRVTATAADAQHELGLTLTALARLAEVRGEDAAPLLAAAREIFDRLGVVKTPDVPLPTRLA